MKSQFLKLVTTILTATIIIVGGFGRLEVRAAKSTNMMNQDGNMLTEDEMENIRDFLLCLSQFSNKAVYTYEYNNHIGGEIEGNATIAWLNCSDEGMVITSSKESAASENKGETIISHLAEGNYLELKAQNCDYTIGSDVQLSGNIPKELKVLNPTDTQQSLCDISGVTLFTAVDTADNLYNYAYKPCGDPFDAVDKLLSTGIAKENDIISVKVPSTYLLDSIVQHNFMRELYEHNKGTTIIVNVYHDETINDIYIQDAEMRNFNTMKYTSEISIPDESIPYVIWNFGDYIKNIHIWSEFNGIIMAPNAVVQLGESGFFRGQIIARQIDSNFTITQVTDPGKQRIIGKLNDDFPQLDQDDNKITTDASVPKIHYDSVDVKNDEGSQDISSQSVANEPNIPNQNTTTIPNTSVVPKKETNYRATVDVSRKTDTEKNQSSLVDKKNDKLGSKAKVEDKANSKSKIEQNEMKKKVKETKRDNNQAKSHPVLNVICTIISILIIAFAIILIICLRIDSKKKTEEKEDK